MQKGRISISGKMNKTEVQHVCNKSYLNACNPSWPEKYSMCGADLRRENFPFHMYFYLRIFATDQEKVARVLRLIPGQLALRQ